MPERFQLTPIYECPFADLADSDVDIKPRAHEGQIRFIDCEALQSRNTLRVYESNSLFPPKDQPYAVISHVWRSYPDPSPPSRPPPTFGVRGSSARAEGISTDVLAHACTAALKLGVNLLWLDRLCVLQGKSEKEEADKGWQIQRMCDIYRRSAVCLVLPAGLGRLARLGEDTPWIHRAWTLQELLAPEKAVILFKWTRGAGSYGGAAAGRVTEVTSRKCAMADVDDILQLCIDGTMRFAPRSGETERVSVPVQVFGTKRAPQVWATYGALRLRGSESSESAVWRSALMRTSSRPVDMIFSIMGLFGVSLDPRRFDEQDRIGVTLALAKEILDKRRTASWIGASFHLPPSGHLSSFPKFPESSVSGRANVTVDGEKKEVSTVIDGSYMSQWWLRDAPRGRISADGYLIFTAPAATLLSTDKSGSANPGSTNRTIELRDDGQTYYVRDVRGNKWIVDKRKALSNGTKTIIVYVGFEGRMSSLTSYKFSDQTPVRAIAIKRHKDGRWHRIASFFLGEAFRREMDSWENFTVAVGGPKSLTSSQLAGLNKVEHKVRRKAIEY